MHERELFGRRVRAERRGGEPLMRAARVWSTRSSAVAAAAPFGSPFAPFGRSSWSARVTERLVRACELCGGAGAGRSPVGKSNGGRVEGAAELARARTRACGGRSSFSAQIEGRDPTSTYLNSSDGWDS